MESEAQLLLKLLEIKSETGKEKPMSDYLGKYCKKMGFDEVFQDKNGNLIDTLKEECQQLYLENVKKNQCLGKVVWWTTIILWRRIV